MSVRRNMDSFCPAWQGWVSASRSFLSSAVPYCSKKGDRNILVMLRRKNILVRMRRKQVSGLVACLLFKKNEINFRIKILETRWKVHCQIDQLFRDKLSKVWFMYVLMLTKLLLIISSQGNYWMVFDKMNWSTLSHCWKDTCALIS